MNKNQFNSWEEIFNFCSGKFNNYDNNSSETESDNSENSNNGSSNNESSSQCNNCKPDGRQAQADESARNADSDIPGGFQDIPPQVLLVIGELLGNVIAGNIPFNVQNVLGNWLQLVGQAIDGDRYYKIAYPTHNLVRTHAQYKLLRSMEKQYDDMRRIIVNLL